MIIARKSLNPCPIYEENIMISYIIYYYNSCNKYFFFNVYCSNYSGKFSANDNFYIKVGYGVCSL